MWNVQCIIWKGRFHYDSPACFSCSIVSFEGSGFFSCVSVFFSLDLSNFSISAMSGLSDMLAGGSVSPRGDAQPRRSLLPPPPFAEGQVAATRHGEGGGRGAPAGRAGAAHRHLPGESLSDGENRKCCYLISCLQWRTRAAHRETGCHL